MNFNNMSVEQIIAQIEDYKAEGHSALKAICERLTELKVRGCKHPLHTDRVYKWHKHVTNGRLLPGIVEIFTSSYLEHLIDRPADLQRQIMSKREIDVAQIDRKTGQIVDNRKPAIKLSLADFRRVFPKGRPPATLKEQRDALQAEIEQQPVMRTRRGPVIRAIREDGILMVGATKVPLHLVAAALVEIGAKVSLPDFH